MTSDVTPTFEIFDTPISTLSKDKTIEKVAGWIRNNDRGRMVTFTNVHMLIEGTKSRAFHQMLREMDLNCPDGMPVVWTGRVKDHKKLSQVCGPEFMPRFCEVTADQGIRHFFYGGADGVAEQAAKVLQERIPNLQIAGILSPPFRRLSEEEDNAIVAEINATQPDMIWVCLGCPKQEIWIHEHRSRLNASVLLAVGMAFDVVAGTKGRAPKILRRFGMEWLYRLYHEPRRLWRRYLVYNSIFLYRLFWESFRRPAKG